MNNFNAYIKRSLGLDILRADFNKLAEQLNTISHHHILTSAIDSLRHIILKNETFIRIEKPPQPSTIKPHEIIADYSIGYSLNLLNNAYNFCKIARKHGKNAYLFLEPNFGDNFPTSLPVWEEVAFRGANIPETINILPPWQPPEYVKYASWDLNLYANISIAYELAKMKELFKNTSVSINNNHEYLLAYTVIPHRNLLELYNTVDMLHVSGTHIGLASFANKPYVTFPYGTDLYTLPFEDTEIGWMQVRGFRKASRHVVSGKIMMNYMTMLGIPRNKIDLVPLMIDTDIYAPYDNNLLRSQLRQKYPGKVIFLLGARQNWLWKGSDKFLRAISHLNKAVEKAIFLIVWYGQDINRSQELINSLGIDRNIIKLGVLSKKSLTQYMDACDVCIDQFTHGGLGTFALESMGFAKPLITYYDPAKHFDFDQQPPLFNAQSEEEIAEAIKYCIDNSRDLADTGNKNRKWVERYHGYKTLWPVYDGIYARALTDFKFND